MKSILEYLNPINEELSDKEINKLQENFSKFIGKKFNIKEEFKINDFQIDDLNPSFINLCIYTYIIVLNNNTSPGTISCTEDFNKGFELPENKLFSPEEIFVCVEYSINNFLINITDIRVIKYKDLNIKNNIATF